jgi:Flp pilus assembly protein TadG
VRRRLRSGGTERGAVLVELTFMVPLLIGLAIGAIEFGTAWGARLKTETAARAGARVGTNLGSARLADYNLLQSVKSVVSEIGLANVDYVVVYKSSDANGALPTGCGGTAPASQSGLCNVYTGAQLGSLTQSSFTGTTSCGTGAPDRFWCPTTRQDVQHLGTDYLGVWVKAKSPTLTGMFGSLIKVESRAVMRLEPTG